MGDIEANRLTEEDRARIAEAIRDQIERWDIGARQHYGAGASYAVQPADRDTLERAAWHSIGCGSADLRDSELAEIAETVRGIVAERDRAPLPDTTFYRAMRSGHLARTGHQLDAYHLPVDPATGIGGGIVRVCCGEGE